MKTKKACPENWGETSTFLIGLTASLLKKQKAGAIGTAFGLLILPIFFTIRFFTEQDGGNIFAIVFLWVLAGLAVAWVMPRLFSTKKKFMYDLANAFYFDGATEQMLDAEMQENNIEFREKYYAFTKNYIFDFDRKGKELFNVICIKDIAYAVGERTNAKNDITFMAYDGTEETLPQPKRMSEVGASYRVCFFDKEQKPLKGFHKKIFSIEIASLQKTIEFLSSLHSVFPDIIIGNKDAAFKV